jgi:hypothetical protein
MILPHAHYPVQYGDKGADSIWVSPEHDVAETDIVVCGDGASRNTGVRGLESRSEMGIEGSLVFECTCLLIKLHVLHNLEGQREVAEKNVHP